MSLGIAYSHPGFEREIDSLQANYGGAAFIQSILKVYIKDCPKALTRLRTTLDEGNVEAARHAIHSVANIMGIVGPASSRSLIESITTDLAKGNLEAAVCHAKTLETLVQEFLVSIQVWLETIPQPSIPSSIITHGDD